MHTRLRSLNIGMLPKGCLLYPCSGITETEPSRGWGRKSRGWEWDGEWRLKGREGAEAGEEDGSRD